MSSVGYSDITDLSEYWAQQSGITMQQAAAGLIAETTQNIENYAQMYVPTRTGELKGSITSWTQDNGLTGVVAATAPYALFVELGTGQRGEFPGAQIVIRPRTASVLRFVGADGKVHYAKVVRSPGMAAHPFLRPALEQAIADLEANLGVAAMTSVLKGPNG